LSSDVCSSDLFPRTGGSHRVRLSTSRPLKSCRTQRPLQSTIRGQRAKTALLSRSPRSGAGAAEWRSHGTPDWGRVAAREIVLELIVLIEWRAVVG